LAEPVFKGQVLDVGCGPNLPDPLVSLKGNYGQLDGVDPDPGVLAHPLLTRRWHGTFEESRIPNDYDLAYAYNVVEHVAYSRPFFEKVREVLKPGGVFWALTPHGNHPFAWISRMIELWGGKRRAREALKSQNGTYTVNDYSAYYRLNKAKSVVRAIDGLGFSRVTFYYYPCMQWDMYFPKPLRWGPHLYDLILGCRYRAFMLIFAYRLQV
jgi:SAM-dependent methyltransferase